MPYYFVIFVILIAVIVFLYIDNTKLESEINKTKMQAEMRITETHKKCENEKQDLITKHNLQIATLLQQHEKQVQQIREEIENRKTILSQMSEKELLANVMIALDGYSTRFERLESQLTEEKIVDKMNSLLDEVTFKINHVTGSLTDQIENMINSIMDSLNDSSISAINSNVCSYGNSIRSDIEDVSDDLDSLSSTVNSIYTSVCDKYSYDSLASEIDSLQSAVEEAKEAAESAREAAESAKDAIESQS